MPSVTLVSFKNDVQRLSELEFARQHPYAVFCNMSEGPMRPSQRPPDFEGGRRGSTRPMASTVREPTDDARHIHAPHWSIEVLPIRKASASPFETQVSIGRASTNDIVIPGDRVSKRHAYVLLPSAATSRDARWVLLDAQSRNGVRVNSVAIAPGKQRALEDGDLVGIGGARLRFFGPYALHSLLRYWGEA
jgi:hypothetical protein